MLARTRLKLKNAESSIAFLQEQHAKTLEDLHKEIERLQKKSARLTFQLTMTGNSQVNSDQAKLEEDLISEVAKLQSDLSKEQEKSSFLTHQVDHLLAKHMEDTTSRDEVIQQLNSELDTKANTIVLLTQQLYRVRTRLKLESEEKLQSTAVCVCPHCLVHKKIRSGSAADSRLSPLHESDPISLENPEDHSRDASSADSAASKNWLSPPLQSTPPLSPHPPPASAPRSHIIKRRASTPVRRQTPSPKDSQSHRSSSRQSLRPAIAAKDTGKLSSELRQLLNLKDKEVKVSRRRQTHPVLPPIASSSNLTDNLQDEGVSPSSVTLDRSSSGHYICATVPVPMPTDASQIHHHHHQHRRLILAKSKGLSSAPSKLRVLRYSSHGGRGEGEEVRGGGGVVVGDEEGGEEEGDEANSGGGTLLLVKETDQDGRGGGVGQTQWAAAESDACSS